MVNLLIIHDSPFTVNHSQFLLGLGGHCFAEIE